MTILKAASPVAGDLTASSGGEVIADKEDVLSEILLRLPTKYLLQCCCVSKHWHSLISAPHFRRRHCRRHASTSTATGLLLFRTFSFKHLMDHLVYFPNNSNDKNCYSRTIPSSIRRFHYPLAFSGFHHLHSCNGLLCFGLLLAPCECNLYVYNPCTCSYASLSLPKKFSLSTIKAINLAFDPSRSEFYRIICIYAYNSENDNDPFGDHVYKILIYASESGTWKDTGKGFSDKYDYLLKRGVFSRGCIHWVGENKPFLAFDVENERFRTMPSTSVPENGRKICYFGDWGGRLHVIQECDGGAASLVDVMELQKDYSGWSLKYRIDIGYLGRGIGGNADGIKVDVLCLVEANGEGKTMLIVSAQGRILSYDIVDRTFEEVCNVSNFASVKQDPLEYKYKWGQAFQHFETLACV
ncbi:PREDICTED: F-box protein At5g07610-like [Nicotiana attenuata]|uniref:F-box protein n=1 Tax=Nicotiana attenuata TaxID=49451 RepID=A0A1J6KUL8_NICAT|nr:PREDICTED: F-box protein At5g07610-like [Nicotiana attenuata]OIT26467.1 f-box protein [Nicotiana attenuata]